MDYWVGEYIVTCVQIERKLRAIFFAGRGKFESDCRRFSITIFLSLNHYISYKVFGTFSRSHIIKLRWFVVAENSGGKRIKRPGAVLCLVTKYELLLKPPNDGLVVK